MPDETGECKQNIREINICPKCGKHTLFQSSGFSDIGSADHPLGYARQETYMCINEKCRARFIRRYKPDFYNVAHAPIVPEWMKRKFRKYFLLSNE